ncbi:hypothetical protein [Hymenobacter cavernae]|uniref:Uncharacterized protein n=1 Tax=Hymenobacter cavernae TaxID=2044852 RepID=A0ABQ1UVJ9_9BACT|nr:hypothetical protein [Hymenobacter cavernae]GGF28042.1 hypothetical protein GCM10011383_44740 [Hymenobacter cavernae]
MKKITAEAGAYDLIVAEQWLYYRVQLTRRTSNPYAFFKHNLVQNIEVSEQEFNQAKYRGPLPPFQLEEEVVFLPQGNTLRCSFQESIVRLFSPVGELLRTLPESLTAGDTIYSIAVDAQQHVWTAEPSFHYVGQYELATGQRLFSLGGSYDPGEFNHPEDIRIDGRFAFISDMGHERIVCLDTQTKALRTYRTFTQPVWQYRRWRDQEVVRLQDGLYVL